MQTRLSDSFGVHVYGEGDRTVVMGHGFGSGQSSWQPLVARLTAAGYRVLTYDAAGTCGATLPLYQAERHDSLFGFAEDLLAVLAEHEIADAHYVGHSAGGMIGLLAANGEPWRFRSLSLIGSSARYIDDPATEYIGGFSDQQVGDLIEAMRGDYAAWANGFARLVVANPERPNLALEFSRSLMTLRPDIASAVLETILRSDHRDDARQVGLPVQILQTERDPAVPLPAARWLAQATSAADVRIIPVEGHFPHISDPGFVGAALLDFLGAYAGN